MIILLIQRLSKGFIKSIAILLGLLIGTTVASFYGLVDTSNLKTSNWLELPRPFRFSGFEFEFGTTIVFVIIAIVSLIESTGVYHALSEITKQPITRKDLSKVIELKELQLLLVQF